MLGETEGEAMTEEEWQAGEDPTAMLDFLQCRTSDRKFRLLACACCRPHASAVGGPEAELAVTFAELQADGGQGDRELQVALCALLRYPSPESLGGAYQLYSGFVVALDTERRTLAGALSCLAEAVGWNNQPTSAVQSSESTPNEHDREATERERASQVTLLRDIFGNPFRPVSFAPAWRTATALILARQMYESRDFSLMPILADALQDAGCEDEQVLTHCRDAKQPHVRGCWVVDLVLDKE